MHICVVAPDYPTSKTIDFVFVAQLCRAMALKGVKVSVVAPQTLTKCLVRHIPVAKRKERVYVTDDKYFTLIRPKYWSIGNLKVLLKDHNGKAYRKAVKKGFKRIDGKVDVIYGHFWQSVSAAMPVAQKHHIPLIASSGEELVEKSCFGDTDELIQALRESINGSIHVSTNNRNECLAAGVTTEDKSIVIPNAIDNNLFFQRDKISCRKKLGINNDEFVVGYVGQFTPRKGTLRLNEALKKLGDKKIKAFFLGKGSDVPDYEGIIHCGTVMHDQLPEYLSAADVFVLPTLNEGCCNAIIEALACGLPVISSNLPFNWDVLDESNSIMVDPNKVDEIAEAIQCLKEDVNLQKELSKGALERAASLTLDQRVEKIIGFISQKINDKTDNNG